MDSPPPSARRPCFAEEDNGLASIAEFSGTGNHYNNNNNNNRHHHYRTVIPRRTGSIRSLISLSAASISPRSANFSEFLEACSLCKKPLGGNRDIFMYRDVPFCSEECRQEEIQVDDAKEKRISLAAMKAMRRKQKDSAAPEEARKEFFRAGAVVAA